MNRHFVSTMIAVCCALAFVACKGDVSSVGGAGGGTGGTGGTDVPCLSEECGDVEEEDTCPGAPECVPSCMECACTNKSSDVDPGCADICDNTISGASTPNFCNGSSALSSCEACIAQRCGSTSATCN